MGQNPRFLRKEFFKMAYFALFYMIISNFIQLIIVFKTTLSNMYNSLFSVVVSTLAFRSEISSSNPVFALNTF